MVKRNFFLRNLHLLTISLVIYWLLISCGPVESPANANTPNPSPVKATPVTGATSTAIPIQPTPHSPAIPETRLLTLEYPPKMRAGAESDIVILKLVVDKNGNLTPTVQGVGNVVIGETVEIPNLYETHNVTAEARLDLAGVEVSPPNAIFEPLKPGQSLTFYWSILPHEVGKYRGTVWLHLNFEERSTGEKSRVALSAQIVEIEAVDFFGFSVDFVRTSGVVGSVLGCIVGFPFLDDILKFIFRKRKPEEKKKRK